jgi:hypothetical protein
MAFYTDLQCHKCNKLFEGYAKKYGFDECDECVRLRKKQKDHEHFLMLDSMSLTDRISRLEEWLYEEKGR